MSDEQLKEEYRRLLRWMSNETVLNIGGTDDAEQILSDYFFYRNNTSKRKSGYYWIKLNGEDEDDPATEKGWEVAYFTEGDGWTSIWEGGSYKDSDVQEIDENRLEKFKTK